MKKCNREHVVILGTNPDGTVDMMCDDGSVGQAVPRKGGEFRLEPTEVDGLYHRVSTRGNKSRVGYSKAFADNWDGIFGAKLDTTVN